MESKIWMLEEKTKRSTRPRMWTASGLGKTRNAQVCPLHGRICYRRMTECDRHSKLEFPIGQMFQTRTSSLQKIEAKLDLLVILVDVLP